MDSHFLKIFFFKALPISALLFLGVLLYFRSLSQQPAVEKSLTPAKIESTVIEDINQATATIQCLRTGSVLERTVADCENKEPEPTTQIGTQINTNGQAIVFFIFFLQWLCLNCQVSLFFMARDKRQGLDPAYGYLADWSINAGPMLGVLGTIVSFAFLLADSGANGLAALFNGYFFNAAITTIMGGGVYVVCLLLMVWIGPAIRQ